MSIFDQMKNKAQSQFKTAVRSSMQNMGNQKEAFTFVALPESVAQMRTLPEAAMDTPFKTAALTVCALCAFAADQSIGTEMLNFLRGPRPLNGQDISFIKDRFRGGARSYIIFSYFTGATPENNYTHPDQTLYCHNFLGLALLRRRKLRPTLCGLRRSRQSPACEVAQESGWPVVSVGTVPADRHPPAEGQRPVGIGRLFLDSPIKPEGVE